MTNGNNIPVTLQGSMDWTPLLVVDKQEIAPSKIGSDVVNSFWSVILDLSDPTAAPLVNTLSTDNREPPSEVTAFVGKPGYLLCFSFVQVFTSHMAQGNLYQFLRQVGAGTKLDRAEQLVEQTGSNVFGLISYTLAATTLDTDEPGFEALDFYHPALLTFQLMPVDVNGKTTWMPVQPGS